jgi:hypothetical protein
MPSRTIGDPATSHAPHGDDLFTASQFVRDSINKKNMITRFRELLEYALPFQARVSPRRDGAQMEALVRVGVVGLVLAGSTVENHVVAGGRFGERRVDARETAQASQFVRDSIINTVLRRT